MITMRRCLAVSFAMAVMGMAAAPAMALTAQEIADSVIDELNNVSDYTAAVDIDFDDVNIYDMTDGALQWKRNGGTWMVCTTMGAPYGGAIISDGTVCNVIDYEDRLFILAITTGNTMVRARWGTDMFNMENILASEQWSKDAGTETVNSVSCYRLYTSKSDTNYEVWVDVATATKVIRVKATDGSNNLHWQLDYSDYSDVESTAQLPSTIVAKRYVNQAVVWMATYSLSDININENLSNSIFDCVPIP